MTDTTTRADLSVLVGSSLFGAEANLFAAVLSIVTRHACALAQVAETMAAAVLGAAVVLDDLLAGKAIITSEALALATEAETAMVAVRRALGNALAVLAGVSKVAEADAVGARATAIASMGAAASVMLGAVRTMVAGAT